MNQLLTTLDEQFARLHEHSCALLAAVPAEKLYWQPRPSAGVFPVYSCGEHILRSAAAVEQTFGGITVNLWDDPFEWTLPESLPAPEDVARYLEEAEATRRRAFEFLRSDADLSKEIAAPPGEMRTLIALAAETLARAAHHQGRAYATFRLFSDVRLPGV
ncbi:MAG TPA: DinB family protein [Pyrinomonadaceae bacterium]|nr:DinB family protein [Pyrinomonadaceae bacterium]